MKKNNYKNMLRGNLEKQAFTIKKYTNDSLVSESKSYAESDLVSSFDSKELATLQNETIDNNSKDKNRDMTAENNSYNNNSLIKENIISRSLEEEKKLIINTDTSNKIFTNENKKRNTIMEEYPNFSISKLFF